MRPSFVFKKKVRRNAILWLVICVVITLSAQILANAAMTNWYTVEVSNITFENQNGLTVTVARRGDHRKRGCGIKVHKSRMGK